MRHNRLTPARAATALAQAARRATAALAIILLTATTAGATDLTAFLTVSSSGTASGYFAFSDHFYKVDWTGINTSQTTSVQLTYDSSWDRLRAQRNGDTSSETNLYTNADAYWKASDITGLTPGQSSSGYTSFNELATGASTSSKKKVCTVTCVAALKPKWNWSSDHSTCTATFMCAENTSLTATVNATVTSSSSPYAANVTFNGTSYSYVAPVTYSITYVLNGGTNAASNPNTYRDDETVTLSDPMRTGYIFEGWYDNSGFSGTAVTGIPYDSSGDKTFYAKWKSEIDGLTYDATIGGFIIDSPEALNTLATYSQSNNCSGKTFKQTADITLSGNFTGIGCYDHPFSGTYDGGNYYITGLYKKKFVNYLGFFLKTDGATISNVRLVSPYIDSSNTAGTSFSNGIGGLIGSSTGTTVSNCYVLDPTVIGNSGWSGAIVGWGSVSGNYYYTENDALPAVGNGSSTAIRLRKLTLPGGMTGGSVTASSGVQLNYNSTLYCAENASVTLTITPERGYILSALTVNGTNVTGSVSNNSYTFNMPTEDITVTAAFVKETFTYVDMNGVTQTVEAERITSDSRVGLYSGWYAVGGNVTRNRGFNLTSGVDGVVINIILCDGATLSLPNSIIDTAGGGKPNLVIWGQENGTGTLSCLSIPNQVTSVTVNGGKLYCGVSNYNCAINGNLIINGGEVHLTAESNTCVNGSVTYNGGILDTKKISGSTTLNWSNATIDRVKVSEYGGSVTIADGKFFKDAGGNYYYGSLTDAQKNAIKNVELQPSPNAHFITVDAAVHGAPTAPAVAESGNTVRVTVAPDTGYKVASVKYNNTDATKADDTHFTFTMPGQDVTIAATFTPDPAHFSQSGDTYTIHTATGWNVFCDLLADNARGYFSGKTVVLANDITVTRMAGGDNHGFTGTFDGKGYTLTLDYGTAEAPIDAQFVAPFVETLDQPTFRNLTIDGTIYATHTQATDHDHVGGLIGHLFGTVTIEQCTSLAEIHAKSGAGGFVGLCEHSVSFTDCHSAAVITSPGGNNSGFVAWSRASGWNINFTGCLFDGKLLQQNGNGASNGGFIGWTGANKTVTITNCLCAPATLADGETMASSNSATFARGWNATTTATNSYYTQSLGAAQGVFAYVYTPATVDFVPANVGAKGTAYGVSGITAYADGLKYNGKFYLVKADVTLADNADNSGSIIDNQVADVTLAGRTLYKDGSWNTLCLPFSVSTASGTLSGDGVKAMTLNTTTSNLADGTLTLNFTDATGQTIPAGTPFIIKWDESGTDIENPVFEDVTIDATSHDATVTGMLTFTGTYAPLSFSAGDRSVLLLGSDDKLCHPSETDASLGACRAYVTLQPSTPTVDVDGNGLMDTADVTALVSMILGKAEPTAAADVDGSGRTTIADVAKLVDLILDNGSTAVKAVITNVGITFIAPVQ